MAFDVARSAFRVARIKKSVFHGWNTLCCFLRGAWRCRGAKGFRTWLALRAKVEGGWALISRPGFSEFLFFRHVRVTVYGPVLNDHVEGFITPADEKRARVGWISAAHPPGGKDGGCASLIHPTVPNQGCCFIVTIM